MTPEQHAAYAKRFAGRPTPNSGLVASNYQAGNKQAAFRQSDKVAVKSTDVKPDTSFLGTAKRVAVQTGNIAGAVLGKSAQYVGNTAIDVGKELVVGADSVADVVGLGSSSFRQRAITSQLNELTAKQDSAISAYKSGKMTRDNYLKTLSAINDQLNELNTKNDKLTQDADPRKHAEAVVMSAVDVLTLGKATTVKSLAKEGVEKEFLSKGLSKTVEDKISSLVMKVPAAKELIERNAKSIAKNQLANETLGQYVARNGKQVAIGLLIKRPIFYQMNIENGEKLYVDMVKGDYGSAAKEVGFIGLQMIGGGPLGAVFRQAKIVGTNVKNLALGQGSFIDEVSKGLGQKPSWMAEHFVEMKNKAQKVVAPEVQPKYSIANSDITRTRNPGMNEDGFTVEDWGGKKRFVSLENASPQTRQKVHAAEAEYEKAKAAHNGTSMAAKQKVNDAYHDAIVDLKLHDYATTESGGRTFNSRYNDWLEQKYKDTSVDGATIKDMAANPQKYRQQFEAETAPKTTQATKAADTYEQFEKDWRVIQEVNLKMADGDAQRAAQMFLRTYTDTGTDLTSLTFEEVSTRARKWVNAYNTINQMTKQGLVKGFGPEDVGKLLPVRWAQNDREGLIKAIQEGVGENAGTLEIQNIISEIADRPGSYGASETLMGQIMNVLNTSRASAGISYKQAVMDGIKEITTASVKVPGIPKKIAKDLAKDGYIVARPSGKGVRTPVVDPENTHRLMSAVQDGEASALFEVAQLPHPVLSAISGALDRVGLSLQSRNELSYNRLKASLAESLSDLPVVKELGIKQEGVRTSGDVILGKLQQYVENMQSARLARAIPGLNRVPAVTDIRQLTVSEVQDALSGAGFKLSKDGAKDVQAAVVQGYLKMPLELRGLGDKLVDISQAAPVIGTLLRLFSRVQSALRYTYNPFFRTQERVETSILSRMQADRFMWTSKRAERNQVVSQLENSGLFRSSLSGVAANDATFGRISANISKAQKQNLAGLAIEIAKKQGTTVEDIIQSHPEQIDDALKVIVQYPSRGAISSPMARTLNIAFFPLRYNAKVTALAAKKLSEYPPSIQLATLNSLMNMADWLKSDEGLRWQSEHADAIKVFQWATPFGNVQQFSNLLTGHIDAPGNLGLIGGLPFGIISQILDGQGIIQLNTPYVDPSSGTVIPDYIPRTTKARAATALQDLLNMTFSYPGRTLGLPGKGQAIRKWVDTVIQTNGGDYEKVLRSDKLTDLQKNLIRVVHDGGEDQDIDEALYLNSQTNFNWYTLPPEDFMVTPLVEQTSLEKRTGLPSGKKSSSGKKVKKTALPIPSR